MSCLSSGNLKEGKGGNHFTFNASFLDYYCQTAEPRRPEGHVCAAKTATASSRLSIQ